MNISKIVFIATITAFMVIASSCSKSKMEEIRDKYSPRTDAPDEVLTPAGVNWHAGTLPSIFFYEQNRIPESAGGNILMLKFSKDGHYEQFSYIDKIAYGKRTRIWTNISGTVVFENDDDDEREFTLHPVSGSQTKRIDDQGFEEDEISQQELKTNNSMSATYLYRTSKDPANQAQRILTLKNRRQNNVVTTFSWEH